MMPLMPAPVNAQGALPSPSYLAGFASPRKGAGLAVGESLSAFQPRRGEPEFLATDEEGRGGTCPDGPIREPRPSDCREKGIVW
jgi:hypothetical protein